MYGVKSDKNRFILPWVLSRTLYSHNKVMKMKIKCYILRKLIRDSVPNFFIEVTFCITNTYISNSPKTFFSPNHIVCTSILNTVCPVFCSGNCGYLPAIQVFQCWSWTTFAAVCWGHTLRTAFLSQPCHFSSNRKTLLVCTWLSIIQDTDVHKLRLWETKRMSYFFVFSCFSYWKHRSVVFLTCYMSDLKLKFLMNIVAVQTLLMKINTWSLCSSG